MRIYLDACALNRLTDDQSQPRIREEARAVERIFQLIASGRAQWIASTTLHFEINRNPNREARFDALKLLSYAGQLVAPSASTVERAQKLESLGFGPFDALHLASAEQNAADVLITTDDRFCKLATRGIGQPATAVMNPIVWLRKEDVP